MAMLKHELWIESDQEQTFSLAGPMGNQARATLPQNAKLIWTVDAGSHFEAMTLYYQFMGRGIYTSEHEWDHEPYSDEWCEIQENRLKS